MRSRQIVVGLFELATLPARTAIAEQRFRAAQFRTAEAVLRLAAEARREYYRAIAANQQVAFMQQALGTAETASELAKQLGESGSLNKLEQAREHAFYQELGAQLARARIEQKVARERLIRQLGLWARDIDFRLPNSLPALPPRIASAQDIERRALERRVDLQALRHDLNAVAGQFGLTNATRFVSDIELAGLSSYERTTSVFSEGGETVVESERIKRRGLEIAFTIPIFDFGAVGVAMPRRPIWQQPTGSPSGPSTCAPRRARLTCATAATTTSRVTTKAASCRYRRRSRMRLCSSTAACSST
ncbi:hypothetical protein BB934_42165 (plasmid) [Microvirga ossetica]|uniref:TolC family protein n=1 Tax=Microvirga ossetica TaxID=1882682 RepID=A0A1B2EXT3_9HYPH|nr:hypothetical protein BB934_42165 [Microvirga ossetica]